MSLINDDFYANATKGTINCNSSSNPKGVEEDGVDRDSLLSEMVNHLDIDLRDLQEELIHTLAKGLDDEKSLALYRLLATHTDHAILEGALSSTLEADNCKMIRTTKPIYFLGILKNLGIQTKFKH